MKKSILLGSAAALVAVSGAQAADLPVVEPVDYVRVCDAFGAGFHYIPGTETCLKFSGRVRTEIGVRSNDDDGMDDDTVDTSFLNSNFELVVNASSMTEVGMLVGQFAIAGSNEGSVSIGDAWITIGENILVGREISRYDFGGGYGIYDGLYVDEGINQFTFIMPFGNGLSMTLGLEDGRDRRAKIAQYYGTTVAVTTTTIISSAGSPAFTTLTTTLSAGSNVGVDATYAGMEIPDVVASLRISQGWGSAQISGAMHQIRSISTAPATGFTTTTSGGSPVVYGQLDEDYGWAVQAGVELNVGSMTKVKVVGAYADGAMHYIGGADYYEAAVDVVTGNITDTLDGWYVLAGLSHDFSSDLNLGLTGAYHDFDDQAEIWMVSATLEYEVVENLVVSLAGQYTDTEEEMNTALGTAATDTENWEAKLRIQRNF
jgi:opacity protein-like surface antigen